MSLIKDMPRGPVEFVVMAPPRDVTGKELPPLVVTSLGRTSSDCELIVKEDIIKAHVSF